MSTLTDRGTVVDDLEKNCLCRPLHGVEQDRFKAEAIDLIINTHAHPDQCLDNVPTFQKGQTKLKVK